MGNGRIGACLLVAAIFLASTLRAAEVCELSCDHLSTPLGIDSCKPVFSWMVKSGSTGDRQTHCRILVASSPEKLNEDNGDLWDTGKMRSSRQLAVDYAGVALTPGQMAWWKVKVWTRKEGAQEWSAPAVFSVGLLRDSDWKGRFICAGDADVPSFRKVFTAPAGGGRYLVHVNSLGYHEVFLNGCKVGDAVLQPAVSQCDRRSLICTYDLSGLVREGRNELVVQVSEGWQRAFGDNKLCPCPAVRVQLQHIGPDGLPSDVLWSDDSWDACDSGRRVTGSWRPFEFGGEIVNVGCRPVWEKARIASVKPHPASPQMVEPNRIIRSFNPVAVTRLGQDSWLLDFGTSLTGLLEVDFPRLREGDRVVMDYADCLDAEGSFPVRRRGDFKDVYVASGSADESFINRFNYHGFRYVRIEGLGSAPEKVQAHLVHTDYGAGSCFESSDADLNAIHDMVHYTVECLTLGGDMVDCPHVERLGYGGDGNASTPSLQTMFRTPGLMYNWARAWADAQREDGGMPHTAPAPYGAGGGPFWCGFLIIASWQTYLHSGDDRLIRQFYPQMKRWIGYAQSWSRDGLLERWGDDPIRKKYYLGDWAAPEKVNVADSSSVSLVSNCLMATCYDYMARIAKYNGEYGQARCYRRSAGKVRAELQKQFYDDASASYATGSQIDLCYPMLAGVTPERLKPVVVSTLRHYSDTLYGGNLAVGLVGVPVVTQWATAAGEADFMYNALKQRTYPGYLYMIDNGATTTWEYWNGYRSHIHNCYNGVGSWFYEALGGIVPDNRRPGFRHFFVRPQIPDGLTQVKVSEPTPYGVICSEWKISNGFFTLNLSVPFGTSATVVLPGGRRMRVGSGEHTISTKL